MLVTDGSGNTDREWRRILGLAAARQLRAKGHRVTILEARNRIGGRVETEVLQVCESKTLLQKTEEVEFDGHTEVVLDLGGTILSGIDGNPLAILATQLDIPLHCIDQNIHLHASDGSVISKEMDKEVRLSLYDYDGVCRASSVAV